MESNTTNFKPEVPANTSGILPGIESVDPEIQAEASELVKNAIAHLADTSRENGSKGGRPPIDRDGLAHLCVDLVFTKHGQCLLRHYRGSWYLYADGKYRLTNEEEIGKIVTGFLTQVSELKGAVTTSLVRDVVNIMKSTEYCGLSEGRYQMPCFISTGDPFCAASGDPARSAFRYPY